MLKRAKKGLKRRFGAYRDEAGGGDDKQKALEISPRGVVLEMIPHAKAPRGLTAGGCVSRETVKSLFSNEAFEILNTHEVINFRAVDFEGLRSSDTLHDII